MMKSMKDKLLKNYTRIERRKFPYIALFLALPLINFALFYVYVNFDSFRLAFSHDITRAFTLDNFETVFTRFFDDAGYLRERILRSLTIWLLSTCITFPISILYSYAIFKKIPLANTFKVIFMIPSLLGGIIMVSLFKNLIGATGPVMELLKTIGVSLPASIMKNGFLADPQISFWVLMFYQFWLGMAANVLLLTGAMARIPQDVFEAAKLDGVGFFREFTQLVLPLIGPTITTMLVMSIPTLFTADYATFTFYGASNPQGVATMGYEIQMITYLLAQGKISGYGYPAALGLTITAITVPIAMLTRKFLEKRMEAHEY